MMTHFNNLEIRYIFKSITKIATDFVSSLKECDEKLYITNTSEQKVLKFGNKTLMLDLLDEIDVDGVDTEFWSIEIHDGNDVFLYTFPNEEVEDAIDYLYLWLINDEINDIVFTRVLPN